MSSIPPCSSSSMASSSAASASTTSSSNPNSTVSAIAANVLHPDVPMQQSLKRKTPPDGDASAAAPKKVHLSEEERLDQCRELFSQAKTAAKSRDDEAIQLFKRALNLGYVKAEKHLALAYMRKKNFCEAAKYLQKILERRDSPSARYVLATMYHKGSGVDKDLNQARELYKQAAAKGHQLAQKRLNKMDPTPEPE